MSAAVSDEIYVMTYFTGRVPLGQLGESNSKLQDVGVTQGLPFDGLS